jgi:hypothetical protein
MTIPKVDGMIKSLEELYNSDYGLTLKDNGFQREYFELAQDPDISIISETNLIYSQVNDQLRDFTFAVLTN